MDFNKILDQKMDDIEAPKILPKGTYLFRIAEPYSEETTGRDDEFTRIQFICEIIEAGDQIDDKAALEEFGNVAGVKVRHAFLFNNETEGDEEASRRNDSTANRLKKFLANTLELDEPTMKDNLTAATGIQFYGTVTHGKNANNPDEPYINIGLTGPVN